MNEDQATQLAESRFPWLGCLGIVALLLLLWGLLFPTISGPGPGAAKRAQAGNDVVLIRTALKHYYTEYGSPPSGDRAQIMAALRGANPRRIPFFEARQERLNALGEYLDPWGTPYNIDTSNPTSPQAYSFGKNTKDEGGVPESDDIPSWR